MIAIQLKGGFKFNGAILFGLIYLALAIWFIPGYFMRDANGLMGLILVPYITTINKGRLRSGTCCHRLRPVYWRL